MSDTLVDKNNAPLAPLPPPTPEFLAELLERAKRYGWSGDYVEIDSFLRALYGEAKIELPNGATEPYEYGDAGE